MCFPLRKLVEKLKLQELSLSHAKLSPPECRLSCTDWIWAHLFQILPLFCQSCRSSGQTLLILQLFLTPALLRTIIPFLTLPSYPLPLLPVFRWLFPLPGTLFSFLSVISLLPLISLATSVLSSPCSPLFPLVYQCNVCPDPPSLLFLVFLDACFYPQCIFIFV